MMNSRLLLSIVFVLVGAEAQASQAPFKADAMDFPTEANRP
jgi:hypothetical protein